MSSTADVGPKLSGSHRPPVKLACLSCRASRIRCDGQNACFNCITKGNICTYIPSRRGGPRYSKKKPGMMDNLQAHREPSGSSEIPTSWNLDGEEWLSQLASMSGPGAGLRSISTPMEEIDSIFDSVFAPAAGDPTVPTAKGPLSNQLQLYGSDEDLLDAYYVFIHPYHPILPPTERSPVYNRPLYQRPEFEPSGPLGLAISAILVLIPHPEEINPSRTEYVKLRRDFAHSFARDALAAVVVDSGLLDQHHGFRGIERKKPFHPKLPVHLESIVALNLLSVYEYAQRGNLSTMRDRAGEALIMAMKLSLHESLEEDDYASAKGRAWWMTYIVACQAAIVSSLPTPFNAFDPRFVTPYPEGWKIAIEAQQTLLEAAAFVRDLEKIKLSGLSVPGIGERMLDLDAQIGSLLFLCRDPPSMPKMAPRPESPESMASTIMITVAEIRLHTARIKAHRLCAFQHIPSFHQRLYEFGPIPTGSDPNSPLQPPCGNDIQAPPSLDLLSHSSLQLPFSSYESSKVCFYGALNIVNLLQNLPFPNPTNEIPLNSPPYLSTASRVEIPRSILTFACCGMQSGYVMLMLCLKARFLRERRMEASNFANTPSLTCLLNELHQSLRVLLRFLNNCSVAFEALQGMRGGLPSMNLLFPVQSIWLTRRRSVIPRYGTGV